MINISMDKTLSVDHIRGTRNIRTIGEIYPYRGCCGIMELYNYSAYLTGDASAVRNNKEHRETVYEYVMAFCAAYASTDNRNIMVIVDAEGGEINTGYDTEYRLSLWGLGNYFGFKETPLGRNKKTDRELVSMSFDFSKYKEPYKKEGVIDFITSYNSSMGYEAIKLSHLEHLLEERR